MTLPADRKPLEERLRDAASQMRDATSHVEEDVGRVITYINDEVIPDVRRNGSEALRLAAAELRKLAERMDDANRKTPPAP